MREVWLRPNLRALTMFFVLAAGVEGVGFLLVVLSALGHLPFAVLWAGVAVAAAAGLATASLAWLMALPRLAYADGQLLVYLRSIEPIAVPIGVVECFFLGQAPSMLPQQGERPRRTVTVVIRLAESASQWHQRAVHSTLGEWRDGYIIVRGTWCEPLTKEVVAGLNKRLVEARRAGSVSDGAAERDEPEA